MTKSRKFLLGGLIFGFLGLLYFGLIIATGDSHIGKWDVYTDRETGQVYSSDYSDLYSYKNNSKYYKSGYKISCRYYSDLFPGLKGYRTMEFGKAGTYDSNYLESDCISEARSEWLRKVIFAVLFPSMLICLGCGLGFLLTGKKKATGLPPVPPPNYPYRY